MAFTYTQLDTGYSSSSAADSFTTASVSPTGDALILLFADLSNNAGSPIAAPTVSGFGLTWVQHATAVWTAVNRELHVFRAQGASPSTGTLTLTRGDATTFNRPGWVLCEVTGVAVGNNGADAIQQVATDATGDGVSYGSAWTTSGSGLAGFLGNDSGTIVARSGWTEESLASRSAPIRRLPVHSRFSGTDTAASLTYDGGTYTEYATIALELVPAAGGGGGATIAGGINRGLINNGLINGGLVR